MTVFLILIIVFNSTLVSRLSSLISHLSSLVSLSLSEIGCFRISLAIGPGNGYTHPVSFLPPCTL